MKIYLQTETHPEGALTPETRPRQLVYETSAPPEQVRQMLGAITQHLGRIAAIPPLAHETNLTAILKRDLAAHDIPAGQGEGGEVVLKIIRREGIVGPAGQADVTGLEYVVI